MKNFPDKRSRRDTLKLTAKIAVGVVILKAAPGCKKTEEEKKKPQTHQLTAASVVMLETALAKINDLELPDTATLKATGTWTIKQSDIPTLDKMLKLGAPKVTSVDWTGLTIMPDESFELTGAEAAIVSQLTIARNSTGEGFKVKTADAHLFESQKGKFDYADAKTLDIQSVSDIDMVVANPNISFFFSDSMGKIKFAR